MKIQAVHLQSAAWSELADFYRSVLGFDFRQTGASAFTLRIGASELGISGKSTARGIYHVAFNIPCNQILAARAWLEQRSIELLPDPMGEIIVQFPNWHARSVYFFDPAGNIMEFIARDDLANESTRPFGPESALGISEIGIVTQDLAAWRASAARQYRIGDFDKQPALPTFAALGDDHGLFIVVPEGRKWFLTDIPATINPLGVVFENDFEEIFHLQL